MVLHKVLNNSSNLSHLCILLCTLIYSYFCEALKLAYPVHLFFPLHNQLNTANHTQSCSCIGELLQEIGFDTCGGKAPGAIQPNVHINQSDTLQTKNNS